MKKQQVISVTSAIGLTVFTVFSGYAAVAQKSKDADTVLTAQLSARVGFVPPLEDGAPTHTRGGATRDPSCDALQVLPEDSRGLTAASRPMVQAYFQGGVKQVWLKIESVDGSEYYEYEPDEYFALPEGKGFASVPLPETLDTLTLDKQYVWSMALLCSNPLGPASPVVRGSIRRVSTRLEAAEMSGMSLLEKANAYGRAGLWYDFIATLTQMKLESPDDMQVAYDWEASLRAEGLDTIFDELAIAE